MFRTILTVAVFATSMGVASAQMAPPKGAVTHQGTMAAPSPKPKMSKNMHSMSMKPKKSTMMHGMKASPKP